MPSPLDSLWIAFVSTVIVLVTLALGTLRLYLCVIAFEVRGHKHSRYLRVAYFSLLRACASIAFAYTLKHIMCTACLEQRYIDVPYAILTLQGLNFALVIDIMHAWWFLYTIQLTPCVWNVNRVSARGLAVEGLSFFSHDVSNIRCNQHLCHQIQWWSIALVDAERAITGSSSRYVK